MSRLLTGDIYYKGSYIPIEEYRNMIYARSLYSLGNEYENTNLISLNNRPEVASSIQTVLNVIPQYNRLQVNTNLLGNIYDAYGGESPLSKIGLIMLGKQMLFNSAMNLSQRYLPSVDVSQALKGNMKGVFKRNEDNTITVKNKEDKGFLDKVGSVASSVLGIDTYDVFGDANPFDKNPTNVDYIRNTGKAQLTRFYDAVNMNIYKPVDNVSNSSYSKVFVDYGDEVGVKVDYNRNISVATRQFFTFNNKVYRPYWKNSINNDAIEIANQAMVRSFTADTDVQEYAPYQGYIDKNFGDVKIVDDKTRDNYVGEESNFTEDGITNKLIWGRDGLIPQSSDNIGLYRGDDDAISEDQDSVKDPAAFNIKEGLLEYTRNLLNATEGQFVDITKKTFKKNDNIVGFQGSPLWEANFSKYSVDSGNQTGTEQNPIGKKGLRQHTIIDPYDRFAKSIRFKGNVVYNGNPNSVIHKSVLPRIHPTYDDDGGINRKNLMFSLENLAIGTIERDKYGVIDDEYGTPIPLSEVGPFAGRIMWFPPYNIEINEVAIAKYESTVMVGRNEPMYNYMNSERTAVLSFTLLVDYPEQLRNLELVGENKNKAIADFFAFGGNPRPTEYDIEVLEKKIQELEDSKPEIEGPDDQAEPASLELPAVTIYFPNDRPFDGEEETIINSMYNDGDKSIEHYEILDGFESASDGNGFGLNEYCYYRTGITKTDTGYIHTYINQYDAILPNDEEGDCLLNKNLLEAYSDEINRKYYDITITGGASKLYLSDNEKAYNEALGNRRVAATKKLIVSKLTAMFGATVANELAQNNIKTEPSTGSLGRSDEGADPDNMHEENVKKERRADVVIKRNSLPVEDKELVTNEKQKADVAKITQQIQVYSLELKRLKNNIRENIYNERSKAILNSFEASSKNEFYPAFHSQTPEDFHRRLTFLQQCTRQGAAQRYDNEEDVKTSKDKLRARNSVFGRQPICIMRVGDFFYTKVVIDSVTIDYADTTWDMNPEGFGMQPMIANVTLQMKLIGGQSLSGPIDALQNAVTFNYYANSNFTDNGVYGRASKEASDQLSYIEGITTEKQSKLLDAYKQTTGYKKVREGDK